MNLYIINNVLWMETAGMVCIVAENLTECRKIFIDEFVDDEYDQKYVREFDDAIRNKDFNVISVNERSGVVGYVYGGE